MDIAVPIFEVLCLRSVSVLPYSEICKLNLLLESQGEKKKTEDRGMMRGPAWGGPQAAGKRHSQPFSQKRLPQSVSAAGNGYSTNRPSVGEPFRSDRNCAHRVPRLAR